MIPMHCLQGAAEGVAVPAGVPRAPGVGDMVKSSNKWSFQWEKHRKKYIGKSTTNGGFNGKSIYQLAIKIAKFIYKWKVHSWGNHL